MQLCFLSSPLSAQPQLYNDSNPPLPIDSRTLTCILDHALIKTLFKIVDPVRKELLMKGHQ